MAEAEAEAAAEAEAEAAAPPLEGSLRNVVSQTSLRWVLVGGKGGVGKTTCSCCLAVQLAVVRQRVLLLSIDPAHNVSDVLDQKLSQAPTAVRGFANLFAMEVQLDRGAEAEGVDCEEAVAFAEVMRLVHSMDFSVVVVDTAPTAHTLRLLRFPQAVERHLRRLPSLKAEACPAVEQQLACALGGGGGGGVAEEGGLDLGAVRRLDAQLRDPQQTTFVCVCLADFLSLLDTRRLLQALARAGVDARNVVVNQLVFPRRGGDDDEHACGLCAARRRLQDKYLRQIADLCEDLHLVKLPLMEEEVRGADSVEALSELLMTPYAPAL